jgi:hypothetical protein
MKTLNIECQLPVTRRKPVRPDATSTSTETPSPSGRVLKVARWLALALHYDRLIRESVIADAAALARQTQLTRARISQILNLVFLAPDIQEALLHWPRITTGRDPITLSDLQKLALTLDWTEQRKLWNRLIAV